MGNEQSLGLEELGAIPSCSGQVRWPSGGDSVIRSSWAVGREPRGRLLNRDGGLSAPFVRSLYAPILNDCVPSRAVVTIPMSKPWTLRLMGYPVDWN